MFKLSDDLNVLLCFLQYLRGFALEANKLWSEPNERLPGPTALTIPLPLFPQLQGA